MGCCSKNSAMSVKVHESHVAKLNQSGQQKVTMGIRPEHAQDAVLVANPDPATLVKSKVEVVEPMGAEIMLYLSAGENAYIAGVDGQDPAKAGQEISMSFDMVHASYFEPGDSGERIA